jgi:hypothetical protein
LLNGTGIPYIGYWKEETLLEPSHFMSFSTVGGVRGQPRPR